jgi:16S rRNA pseudouridine516 synthase
VNKERLDKLLSHEGFGSRQDVKILMHSGAVTVNGSVVTDPASKADPDSDVISVDGEELSLRTFVYLMMNKPQNYVSANKDGLHRTVFDLLDDSYHTPYLEEHLHIIGRLDIDTEGLLLFTTDGELTHVITSPKTHRSKTYFVRLRDSVNVQMQAEYVRRCSEGIHIPPEGNEAEADCRPAELVWRTPGAADSDECELTVYEGKYHEVKRIFAVLGNEVVFLKRLSIGALQLDPALRPGEYRELTGEETGRLKQ